MKNLLLLVLLAGTSWGRANVELDWTNQSDSLQAQVYDLLALYREKLQKPGEGPVLGSGGAVEVKDNKVTLSCRATTLGQAQVMSYQCSVPVDTHTKSRG